MQLARRTKRKLIKATFDVRWLFPIVVIVIAGLLAFSAEIKERVARTGTATSAAVAGNGH